MHVLSTGGEELKMIDEQQPAKAKVSSGWWGEIKYLLCTVLAVEGACIVYRFRMMSAIHPVASACHSSAGHPSCSNDQGANSR